ncbi:hypothetical protein NLA05_19505, partial [Xanthomonas citri pv. anacardii]
MSYIGQKRPVSGHPDAQGTVQPIEGTGYKCKRTGPAVTNGRLQYEKFVFSRPMEVIRDDDGLREGAFTFQKQYWFVKQAESPVGVGGAPICTAVGNPLNAINGNKFESVVDF